jgi:hypothetical protein
VRLPSFNANNVVYRGDKENRLSSMAKAQNALTAHARHRYGTIFPSVLPLANFF